MNIFTEHPHSVNETYLQHMKFAMIFAFNLIIGGIACFIHAIFPFIFQKTGSNFLLKMTRFYIERMPTLDDKVADIGVLINQKKANQSKV